MSSMMCGMMLGAGVSATKTYVDDVFHTQVFKSTNQNADYKVTNNIDNSGEGGFLWYKDRIGTSWHLLWDTERGSNKYIYSNSNSGQSTAELLKSFDSDGYTIKTGTTLVDTSRENVLWNFRKAPGFFTIKEYSGTGSNQSISHDLGSIPGMILIKRTSNTEDWLVYHRSTGNNKGLGLNETGSGYTGSIYWNDTTPTASAFTVGTQDRVNTSGETYIAYIFAGGESTAAQARSVGFGSSSTYLSIPDSNDFDFGSTFTFEAWVKPEFHSGNLNMIFEHGSFQIAVQDTGRLQFDPNHIHTGGDFYSSTGSVPEGQWTHVAVVGTSGTLKMYINGVNDQSHSRTGVDITGDTGAVTISDSTGYYFKGEISNLRIVKGTAVYASSFRPPTEPLTNITNTVLLCCNNSSTTGSTVTPGTITANGSPSYGYPTAEIDSPFDDPAGFVFGENEDQGVIKCGSYVGNGTDPGPEIFLGFEPSWIMLKRTDSTGNWAIFDTMRGIPTGGSDYYLKPNSNTVSGTSGQTIELTGNGFKLRYGQTISNLNNAEMIYVAIRRPDGYVGKPIELGTDVFAMDTGAGSSTIPNFDSGFPVDFAINKRFASAGNSWDTSARLIGTNFVRTESSASQGTSANFTWDSNVGWNKHSPYGSGTQSWMFKRHAGFDVVCYEGNNIHGRAIPHSLSKPAEMIWIKNRSGSWNWIVGHKGLNGGTNPWEYYLHLNTTGAEGDYKYFNDQAPTSTHFYSFGDEHVNDSGDDYIAMLFASVSGISAVGSYTGSSSTVTVTTGFQPRFVIIRRVEATDEWVLLDTARGWGSGNDAFLHPNNTSAQNSNMDLGAPTSTGFTVTTTYNTINTNGENFIYYAHA